LKVADNVPVERRQTSTTMLPRRIPGQCIRNFSATAYGASNSGKRPVPIPKGVAIDIVPPPPPRNKFLSAPDHYKPLGGRSAKSVDYGMITIVGPKGKLQIPLPFYASVVPAWTLDSILADKIAELEKEGKPTPQKNDLRVKVYNESSRKQRIMWGTIRALLNNHVKGVTEGHQTSITLRGVGYRGAVIENKATGGKQLELKVGHNHNVYADIPTSVEVTMTNPTIFEVRSIDKDTMMLFCATVRRLRPPEPYKGKVQPFELLMLIVQGIFIGDETIKIREVKKK
jgi:large subunit ribosomal protein L6